MIAKHHGTHRLEQGTHVYIKTTPRRSEMILLVLSGATLQEAGAAMGVSRERVRQVMKQAGLTAGERQQFSDRHRDAKPLRPPKAKPRHKIPRAERKRRLAQVLETIDTLVAAGKVPSVKAVALILFGPRVRQNAHMYLTSYLGPVFQYRRLIRRLRVVWAMAGQPMPDGRRAPRAQ